jgi:hypothetical protein
MDKMRLMRPQDIQVMVPAGTYVLGDPCYVVPKDHWDELLSSCDYFNRPVGCFKGVEVLGFTTRWGDGTYADNHKRHYPVDAGIIGLVPYGAAVDIDPSLSHIVNFTHDTLCTWNPVGMLRFGSIHIDTDESYED